ncbi:MAG: glycosyltransferase, partial [Pyrinomonadaceae bacterium]
LERFKPDVFHITGLNDVSIMGAYLGWKMDIPLVGSWHTNLHEYAAHRLQNKFGFLPEKISGNLTNFIERKILDGAKLYYKMPQILLAPNQELIEMLEKGTGRKAHLMIRGVDTVMFAPEKRTKTDGKICFGFVGRLRAEKNVRLLAELEKELLAQGKDNIKFLIVGEGSERAYLEQNMQTAEFTGFLEGERLAEAYANIDIFVFPSGTDAFGNVIQEANASGVPCLVTDQGGPKFIVREGETGFIAKDSNDFVKFSVELLDNPEKLAKMKRNSRQFALSRSWESVFESVYDAYREAFDRKKSNTKQRKDD